MYKKFIFLVLCVALSYSASAQYLTGTDFTTTAPVTPKSSVLKFAVKAGLNLTTVSAGNMAVDASIAPGFQIGAAINLRWGYRTATSRPGTGLIGFQPEVLYSNQSVNIGDETLKMNRLAVPLMLKLYPATSFYFEVGPEFSYLFDVAPDSMVIGSSTFNVGECSGLATDVAVGLGYETGFGLSLGARYGLGMTALAKNLPWKTHNIAVTLGWMF